VSPTPAPTTVAAITPDYTVWARWLDEQLDPCWRSSEWNAEHWFFNGDADNDRTVASRCAVARCRALLDGDGLCSVCRRAFEAAGLSLDQFVAEHVPVRANTRRGHQEAACRVTRDGTACARLAHCQGLCKTHHNTWTNRRLRNPDLSIDDWLTEAKPFPSEHRLCYVPLCDQPVFSRRELCRYHYYRYLRESRETPPAQWAATATPYLTGGQFSLLPLHPLVRAELLYVLQRRDARGGVITPKAVRMLVTAFAQREHLVGVTAEQLLPLPAGQRWTVIRAHLNEIERWLTIAYERMTGVEATQRLVWDLRNLDLRDDPRCRGCG
jgi:hypothetical protein